jgi:hypothetical protein
MDEQDKKMLVERMKKLAHKEYGDNTSENHIEADGILCATLVTLGFKDLIDAYHDVNKWYA